MLEKWFKKPNPLKKYEILLDFVKEPLNLEILPEKEQQEIFLKCREYVQDEVLKKIGQYLASKQEADILYNLSNEPIQTTEAELGRHILIGMNKFMNEIEAFAKRAPTEEVKFDKFKIID